MDRRAVPNHHQLAGDLVHEVLEETHYVFSLEGALLLQHVELALKSYATHHREVIAGEILMEDGCLSQERRCEPPWAEDRSPTDRRRRWFCLPSVPLFQRRPFLIFPVFDSLLISLVGSTFGLLQTQPQLLEQAANVSRMIADPKLPSDHHSHSLTRPYISSKPVRLSSLSQKLRQPRSLNFTQTRRSARRRLVSQGLHALFSGTLHPLANRSFTNPQSVGYVRLFPAPLL